MPVLQKKEHSMNIFVGNLAREVTEAEVARLSRCGPNGLRRNRAITPVRAKMSASMFFSFSSQVVWKKRRIARRDHAE
jgi:hypothetical protein